MQNILIIDGQGGGVGKALTVEIKQRFPDLRVLALGTNALATSAMLKAGADAGATGENAIRHNCKHANVILGPIGIVMANALMGELTPGMAEAIGGSDAQKILIPVGKCGVMVAGARSLPLALAVTEAMNALAEHIGPGGEGE